MRRKNLRFSISVALAAAALLIVIAGAAPALRAQPIFPIDPEAPPPEASCRPLEVTLLGEEPVKRPLLAGSVPERESDGGVLGGAAFRVRGQQAGMAVEEPVFVAPETTLSWSWRKEKGTVCILQIALKNPETGQRRYLGYGAGAWSEPPSSDPTVEIFVSNELPRQWIRVERPLHDDLRKVLGWESAQVTGFYLSPWDGEPGLFARALLKGATAIDVTQVRKERRLEALSRAGRGNYLPQRLRGYGERREDRFETSFEECAPGRNSGANEWSAFGIDGNRDFNALGRDLRARYPLFDLVFRLYEGDAEIRPGELESFRLGLVRNRFPAIWAGWRHGGLLYKVSAMTVPGGELGNYDLYKLEVQNLGAEEAESKLVAAFDGPPDMRLEEGAPASQQGGGPATAMVVRGLGETPFAAAGRPRRSRLILRDWGLCDKRAKAYAAGGGPGKTEPAIATYRLGLEGVPVVYRVKAPAGARYAIVLASTPHLEGYLVGKPERPGDLVFEYRAEGCAPKAVDYLEAMKKKSQPLVAAFDGARDVDGDGYVEISAGRAPASRLKHTRLSAIYVFPEGTAAAGDEAVYSGAMNPLCLFHIDVGATPEQGPQNQDYDRSDLGIARLLLSYAETIKPGEVRTRWLKIPSIHRRQPVSMGYIAHAFREVLPGEAAPHAGAEKLSALIAADPAAAERRVTEHWEAFFKPAARFELPDPVLNDIFLSRLATRALLDIDLGDGVVYNACSPFFYFDHAWRDHAYLVCALDLAGLHDRAERLLRAYCMEAKDAPEGPIAFDGKPLRLGMLESGLWNTRPGQYDTQGQNLWALVEHYQLSGRREWLERVAYPYIRRGALWIVESRRRRQEDVKNPEDPRHGLIEPGGMEVLEVGKGMHMYYMNAFAVLGLREAAEAAAALGREDDRRLFAAEHRGLKESLRRSSERTFKRAGLYEGHLWFGVEPEGVGMYGFWAHNCLLWPCRAFDPHDPLLSATWRRLESMSNRWGGGMHSEGEGGFWPYIGADRAIGSILRGEADRALDYFCAFTDTAGGTFSWGEGYSNAIAGGDQPHMWADAQWINLFRHLFAMEDGSALLVAPALFRRWTEGDRPVSARGLPTRFGLLDLAIAPRDETGAIRYKIKIVPQGDQESRALEKVILHPRIARGRWVKSVELDGRSISSFTSEVVVVPAPPRGREFEITARVSDEP